MRAHSFYFTIIGLLLLALGVQEARVKIHQQQARDLMRSSGKIQIQANRCASLLREYHITIQKMRTITALKPMMLVAYNQRKKKEGCHDQ